MPRRLPLLAALALLPAAGPPPPAALTPLVADYASHAIGRFSSAAQHARDPAYDVVEARIVRIWPERTDGLWLYQEQTILAGAGAAPDKPYFQRVGHVRALPDGSIRRDNYPLKAPERFVGLGRPGSGAVAITPDDLGPAGCANILTFVSPGFWTGTVEACASNWRGAARMESVSLLTPRQFVNWDRGLDSKGGHVWGPTGGGYVFDRLDD
ncbi:MAG: chromophore lyase CpcT/CpeT [Sphingomonadaceae bacterium]